MNGHLIVRPATSEDARVLDTLSAELGYATTEEAISRRLTDLVSDPNHSVFVAQVETEVVAYIDAQISRRVHLDAYAEIVGLVVSSSHRSNGIGGALLAHAERWAVENGVSTIRLRSNVKRADAHRFYQREGYSITKTSLNFEKILKS